MLRLGFKNSLGCISESDGLKSKHLPNMFDVSNTARLRGEKN